MRHFRNLLIVSASVSASAVAISIAAGAVIYARLPSDLLFQSEESRTVADGPVFNRIHFEQEGSRDIWMMNQSHLGRAAAPGNWDRLAIVVDRETKAATFYQLEPGELAWSESTAQKEFRVSCALCHSNGPRAVRPATGEQRSIADWARVALWNLRIKRYPRLKSGASQNFAHERVPFRFAGAFANSPLKVATCVYCHREDGPIARGTLVRQNALTISRMVENGHMPPLGIPLPASQRRELERFLQGF